MLLSASRFIRPALRRSSQCVSFSPRLLSTSELQPLPFTPKPPSDINEEMVLGILNATRLFIRHGLGKQRLLQISDDKSAPLVVKWQQMMETFLGTQVHVLAGLGYTPDEAGLSLYNQHLSVCVQSSNPDLQEQLRVIGRDTWREVLSLAFKLNPDDFEEVSIVDARNIMHKVSQKMQQQEILDIVAERCASIQADNNSQEEITRKHQILQDVLVNEVYLGGEPSLVSECGFGPGEKGYVHMQCVMAEHQSDPLVSQYIGAAMMKILSSAGLDVGAMQEAAKAYASQQ